MTFEKQKFLEYILERDQIFLLFKMKAWVPNS